MDQNVNQPKVSVNIATYNRGFFLKQAIDSVLAQTWTDWELLIVDDASTDNTEAIVRPYLADPHVRYFRNDQNLNISFTRNRALDNSHGEYIAILDSDDYWTDPEKLAKQIAFLDAHPDYLAVGTQAITINDNGTRLGVLDLPLRDASIRGSILAKNPLIHSSVLYRRQPVIETGQYDLSLNAIEDYDLWLRLGRTGKLANLADRTVAYRLHAGNASVRDRLRLLRLNISLIKKNRRAYPSFAWALARRSLRYWLFYLLKS
jgi:glycosyltransferase involved in cell wall biosynthesis